MTQWEKKTPEQKQKQYAYNKAQREKKAAEKALADPVEKKAKKSKAKEVPVVKKTTEDEPTEEYVAVDNSLKPDIIEMSSRARPDITFILKKQTEGKYQGYDVIGKKTTEEVL